MHALRVLLAIKRGEKGKKRNKKKLHEPIKTSNAFTRSMMTQNSFNNPYIIEDSRVMIHNFANFSRREKVSVNEYTQRYTIAYNCNQLSQ